LAWRVRLRGSAEKELAKLPRDVQVRILDYLDGVCGDPRAKGRPMKVGRRDPPLWRYPVGDYRLICHLRNENNTVLVLRVGHRREVYRHHD
jgi:mRNA interferase RelE/StbE